MTHELKTHEMILMLLAEKLGLVQVRKDQWEGKYGSTYICTAFGFMLDTEENRKSNTREIIEIPCKEL